MGWSIAVSGVDDTLRSLSAVSQTAAGKVLRRALRASSRILIRAAGARVPRETGLLKKSLGVFIKTYRPRKAGGAMRHGIVAGQSYCVVGARFGVSGKGPHGEKRVPAYYSHLVEKGHVIAGTGLASKYRMWMRRLATAVKKVVTLGTHDPQRDIQIQRGMDKRGRWIARAKLAKKRQSLQRRALRRKGGTPLQFAEAGVTGRVPGYPYLQPAFDASKAEIVKTFKRVVEEELQKIRTAPSSKQM